MDVSVLFINNKVFVHNVVLSLNLRDRDLIYVYNSPNFNREE